MPSRRNPLGGTPPAAASRQRPWLVDLVVVGLGLVLLGGLVWRLGGAALVAHLQLVGWGIALIVGQEIFAIVVNALGWRAAFPAGTAPPLAPLVAARIAGDAVNYLTPTGTLGGEFVRARVLHGRASRLDLATSIAIAKLSQTLAQVGFVAAGLLVLVTLTPLPTEIRLALLVTMVILTALAVVVWDAQRRGMFVPLLRLATRFDRRQRLAGLERRMERLDAAIAAVHHAQDRPFVVSCAWFLLGWALGTLEIALMLWLLGVPVTLTRALGIEVLSVAIDAMLFFVPGKLGTQEGGKVLIFTTLGLDPTVGLAVGVLRRIRELTWALFGLAIAGRATMSRTPDGGAEPARSVGVAAD